MNTYRVRVARSYLVVEETLIDVQAKSDVEARKKALEFANTETLEWKEVHAECTEEPCVTQSRKVETKK